jgi:IS30 family transposase
MLLKIPSRDTATVVGALTKHVRKLPQQLRRSSTWDRGKEMADHKSFTVATNVQVYFCDPHSPWPRGSNENTQWFAATVFPARNRSLTLLARLPEQVLTPDEER